MVRDIRHRLAALEARHHVGPPKFECWVDAGDGYLRNKDGATMARDAFDAAYPKARKIKLNIFENSNRD
jgi:hypothetical protein